MIEFSGLPGAKVTVAALAATRESDDKTGAFCVGIVFKSADDPGLMSMVVLDVAEADRLETGIGETRATIKQLQQLN